MPHGPLLFPGSHCFQSLELGRMNQCLIRVCAPMTPFRRAGNKFSSVWVGLLCHSECIVDMILTCFASIHVCVLLHLRVIFTHHLKHTRVRGCVSKGVPSSATADQPIHYPLLPAKRAHFFAEFWFIGTGGLRSAVCERVGPEIGKVCMRRVQWLARRVEIQGGSLIICGRGLKPVWMV